VPDAASDIDPRGLFNSIPDPLILSGACFSPVTSIPVGAQHQKLCAHLACVTPELRRLDRIALLTASFSSVRFDQRPSEAPALMQRTRLEHSCEVVDAVAVMCEKNPQLPPVTKTALLLAALHHDIGHTPFSHVGEKVLNYLTGFDHDVAGEKLCKSLAYRARLHEPLQEALDSGGFGTGLIAENVLDKANHILSEHPKYLRLGAAVRDVADTCGYLQRDILLVPISSRIALQVATSASNMIDGIIIHPETEAVHLTYPHKKKEFDRFLERMGRKGAAAITSDAIESGLVPSPLVVQEGRRILHAVFNQQPRVSFVNRVLGVFTEMAVLQYSSVRTKQHEFLRRFATSDDETALDMLRQVDQASGPLRIQADGHIAPDLQYSVAVSTELDAFDMAKARTICEKKIGSQASSSEIGNLMESYLQSELMRYFYSSTKNKDYAPPIVTIIPAFSKRLQFSMMDTDGEVFKFSSKSPTITSDRTVFLAIHNDVPRSIRGAYLRKFKTLIEDMLKDNKRMSDDNLFEQSTLSVPVSHFFNDGALGGKEHLRDRKRSDLMQLLSGRVRVGF